MSALMFDQVLRIDGGGLEGFFRVLAISRSQAIVVLAQLPPMNTAKRRCVPIIRVEHSLLAELEDQGILRPIAISPSTHRALLPEQLSSAAQKKVAQRKALQLTVFDPKRLSNVFLLDHPKAVLVRDIMKIADVSRPTGFRLLDRVLHYGFHVSSLYPLFHRSGAPGRARPVAAGRRAGRKTNAQRLGASSAFEQRGISSGDRLRIRSIYRRLPTPKPSMARIYEQVLLSLYATDFKETPQGLVPVLPAIGTYPNQQQVERVIRTERDPLQRILDRTTIGHFNRNHRALKGYAWEGVPGPGHCYAIDSTIADIHLRSSVNRSWILGRPIVYIVVDVWSGAVVGFYVCLQGPSWRTAKLAFFSTCADANVLGELWGYTPNLALYPSPGLPAELRCDRGEYLSAASMATMEDLGVHLTYNPSYRPDLKGSVEVFHRIAKDFQYRFIPGAIDRRREEFELRVDPRSGVFTPREYVQYLYELFGYRNHGRRLRNRLTAEMIADGVSPTPAEFWRWGHQVGLGYRKATSMERIGPGLLSLERGAVTPKGVFMGQLHYEAAFVEERKWTGLARANGGWPLDLLHCPGSLTKTWWVDPRAGDIHPLTLSQSAVVTADASLDEWVDAAAVASLQRGQQMHQSAEAGVRYLSAMKAQVESAARLTAEADQRNGDQVMPSTRFARLAEGLVGGVAQRPSEIGEKAQALESVQIESYDEEYLSLMRQVLHGGR